jgi:hypothetical protein
VVAPFCCHHVSDLFSTVLLLGCWIFSWAMSHICANDEYRSQVGATNRPENIVIHYVIFVSLSSICIESSRCFQFSFTDFSLVYCCPFAQIFPRSQPMRASNTAANRDLEKFSLVDGFHRATPYCENFDLNKIKLKCM